MLKLNRCLRKVPLHAAPFFLMALSACAPDYGPSINGQRPLSPEEMRLQAVETKIADLSRRMNGLEAAQQNANSSDEIRSLRGQVEQLRHDLDDAQARTNAQYLDTDTRLKKVEGGAIANPATGTADNTTGYAASPALPAPAPPPPVSAPSSASADEEGIYLKSFDQLKVGKFDEAIRGFRDMLAKYPQGNYADNGWYWMGESYYVGKHDPANGLKCYQALLQSFPASPKVPDALLKTGSIYQDQQKRDQARAAFLQIIKSYPTSPSAAQARTRLSQLN